MRNKNKKRGIFAASILCSLAVCVVGTLIAVASGMFLYNVSVFLSEKNLAQKKEFETSKSVLDTVNEQYLAQFVPSKADDLKLKLAQLGLTALLETSHIRILYGYDELERILANQASEPQTPTTNPKVYNWPGIRLVRMMYNTTACTTMIEFSGGENKSEQRRQIWRWEYKDGKWIPLAFSDYFIPPDVEINKQGISFMLSPRHDTKLTKLFVLKK